MGQTDQRVKLMRLCNAITLSKPFREAAGLVDNQVSKSTLHRWSKLDDLGRKPRARPKTSADTVERVRQHLLTKPHSTARDVADELAALGVSLSVSSVRACIRMAGFTRKACRWVVSTEAVEAKRDAFTRMMVEEGIQPCDVINFDESHFETVNHPSHGYAPRGQRVNLAVRGYRGSSVSLLLAITSTGERRAAIESGGVNAATVARFIRTHLRDTTKRFLLMDNASIHKTRDVLSACAEVGLAPLFLAPYSPFYAPVEMCFHVLKHGLRATPVRRAGADFRDGLLHDVAQRLSTQAMANMFRKCWERVRARAAAPTGA